MPQRSFGCVRGNSNIRTSTPTFGTITVTKCVGEKGQNLSSGISAKDDTLNYQPSQEVLPANPLPTTSTMAYMPSPEYSEFNPYTESLQPIEPSP